MKDYTTNAEFTSYKSLIAGNFELKIGEGQFTDSEIIVMLGENGTGKTTFIRILAGKLMPDEGGKTEDAIYLKQTSYCIYPCICGLNLLKLSDIIHKLRWNTCVAVML